MPEIAATQTAADMTYAKPHEFMPSGRQNRRAARARWAAHMTEDMETEEECPCMQTDAI